MNFKNYNITYSWGSCTFISSVNNFCCSLVRCGLGNETHGKLMGTRKCGMLTIAHLWVLVLHLHLFDQLQSNERQSGDGLHKTFIIHTPGKLQWEGGGGGVRATSYQEPLRPQSGVYGLLVLLGAQTGGWTWYKHFWNLLLLIVYF